MQSVWLPFSILDCLICTFFALQLTDLCVSLNMFSLQCASQPLKAKGCDSGSVLHLSLFLCSQG